MIQMQTPQAAVCLLPAAARRLAWRGTAAASDFHCQAPTQPRCRAATLRCARPTRAGKGRGLVATSDLRPGQLALIVDPVAVLFGPELDEEALLSHVLSTPLGAPAARLLGLAFDGTDGGVGGPALPDMGERRGGGPGGGGQGRECTAA